MVNSKQPSARRKILESIKVLKNARIKGCSRQAIKREIVDSFGKDISNHILNRAMKDAMNNGLVKFGATNHRFKLTPEGHAALLPPKPVKKKVLKSKTKKNVKKVTKKKNISKRKASTKRMAKKKTVVKKKPVKKVTKKVVNKRTKKKVVKRRVVPKKSKKKAMSKKKVTKKKKKTSKN